VTLRALAQAQRESALRDQTGRARPPGAGPGRGAGGQSLADGTPADDPCRGAIATFVIAVCGGLSVPWLLDPKHSPSGEELTAGLATIWVASFPVRD
jgi:hypothetical protein